MNQSTTSPQFGWPSLDLQDVVKDSIYREYWGSSIKNATEKVVADKVVKHSECPRPLKLSKSVDGRYSASARKNNTLPADIEESLGILDKLQEMPWYFNEDKEHSRTTYNAKNESFFSMPKGTPRLSCDGREIDKLPMESWDTFNPTPKHKELARLSLDSRDGSIGNLNSASKSKFTSRNLEKDSGNSNNRTAIIQKAPRTEPRPSRIVAKLMGLETLPDSALGGNRQMGSTRTCHFENCDPSSKLLKLAATCRPIQVSNSSSNSWKELISPWKNPDPITKPISRFSTEPAPWRLLERSWGAQRPAFEQAKKAPVAKPTNSFPSVYSEVEHRLQYLDFRRSEKDLRALKQILEAMDAKALLDTRRKEQDLSFATQNQEHKYTNPVQSVINGKNPERNVVSIHTKWGANCSKTSESPIMIIKPANLVGKPSIPASSVIRVNGLSHLPKLRGVDFVEGRKGLVNGQAASKDQIPKTAKKYSAINSDDKNTNSRYLKLIQTSTRPQQLVGENPKSSVKGLGSVTSGLQQKKLEFKKKSRPATPASGSSKSRRQSSQQQLKSGSPGGKCPANWQQINNQSSEAYIEVTRFDQSAEMSGSQIPSIKKPNLRLSPGKSSAEIAAVVPEHPGSVSVLDYTFYGDNISFPVKHIPNNLKDDETQNYSNSSSKKQWGLADDFISDSTNPSLTSELNRQKLQNIECLVQKLRQVNSSHDEARTDYIASLCGGTNPDRRYISEILLASGFLLGDLSSILTTFQLHPSGHPINPDLFLVLEQTKGNTSIKEEFTSRKAAHLKPDEEKFHRKLIFDTVNEILVRKLALGGPSPEPWFKPNKLATNAPSAQMLLRELCSEIEQLEASKSDCSIEQESESLNRTLWKDVMNRSENWTDFHVEIYMVVLDTERLIFRDLVNEIVMGGAAVVHAKPSRHLGRLFAQ